jgi:hypothetical protein
LSAALIAGAQIISLDNCENELGGAFLCKMLTQSIITVRELGYSRNIVTAPNNASLFANGNNLVIANDIVRRVLLCRLDAEMERPWERPIKRNLLEVIRDERGKLVCAILTTLRAWHLAGAAVGLPLTGSFEQWSFRIRQPLVWLGYVDPWDGVKEVAADDPRRDELLAVAIEWKRVLGVGKEYRLQTVINTAMTDNDFFQALMTVAGTGKNINNVWAGRWLHRIDGKVVNIDNGYSIDKYKLSKTKTTGNYPHWALVRA